MKERGGRMKRRTKERGTALVEFAFVLPIFILILIGTIEFGIVLHDYLILQNASREGARFAAVGNSQTAIQQRVRDFAFNLNDGSLDVQVTNAQGTRGATVTVQASYPVPLITSLMKSVIHSDTMNLRAEAQMRLE
jgi:Flp pilus assembly protein TadG